LGKDWPDLNVMHIFLRAEHFFGVCVCYTEYKFPWNCDREQNKAMGQNLPKFATGNMTISGL